MDHLTDLLHTINKSMLSNDEGYRPEQMGAAIDAYEDVLPDISAADIVLLGCAEQRGAGLHTPSDAADEVRKEFYKLYYWHTDIRIADLGNIRTGATLTDSYAALRMVVQAVCDAGKLAVVLGGSHDLTLAQYDAFARESVSVEAVGIDATIDILKDSPLPADRWLLDMLTREPNFLGHYGHLAFQSYLTHPRLLETMDKLRFDCYRVGTVKENLEEMEPLIRNSHILSFDLSALAHAYTPATTLSPNGLNGEEACTLMQYAGMSTAMKTIGLYGYLPENDRDALSAKQLSHMLWYLVDGRSRSLREAPLSNRGAFDEFHTLLAEVDTTFLRSRHTGRWWMELPGGAWMACTEGDYRLAAANEYPERWLRVHERP